MANELTEQTASALLKAITTLNGTVEQLADRVAAAPEPPPPAPVQAPAASDPSLPPPMGVHHGAPPPAPGGNGAAAPGSPAALGFTEPVYFVRIKPYNPRRGCVRKRQFFNELGRAINGGTGEPGDVPEWVQVAPDVAAKLTVYHQNDNDPMSPLVLDFATQAEMLQINQVEEMYRARQLGVAAAGPLPPGQFAQQTQAAVRAPSGHNMAGMPQQVPMRQPPAAIPNAAQFAHSMQQAMMPQVPFQAPAAPQAYPAQAMPQAAPPVAPGVGLQPGEGGVPPLPPVQGAPQAAPPPAVQAGRAAALRGVPNTPPPAEDLARTAQGRKARSEAEAALDEAGKYGAPATRIAPK